ncbi:type ISP restriction/modification enzyme, partial [Salmonella enterica]|uniref:type ISP restriction/modification enzyme n=1 Tax=Salmonella enterica TaxID=28901 RepID=UPI003CC7D7E5
MCVKPIRFHPASYRPFNKRYVIANLDLMHRPAAMRRFFPDENSKNVGFYMVGPGSDKGFS